MEKRLWQLTLLLLLSSFGIAVNAQVTTSSMRGRVTDGTTPLMAATVTAIHTPSGTKYRALTDVNGNFFINNMRIGGPYTIKVTFIGFTDHVTKDAQLLLGETFVLNTVMREEASQLGEVVVTASAKNSVFNSARTGAMTALGAKELKSLPTITRSITDFTRLTPQSSGNSFGGRDARMNNITIDGGSFRNNFGLSGDMMPGGTSPISLDAIEAVSVNIAPFDVRLSGFTGASVNAVTKSGTNTFSGSTYTYQRNKGMTGKKVGDLEIPNFKDKVESTYGVSVGGPIIKDKLFFFVNAEFEKKILPYNGYYPSTDGKANRDLRISRTTIGDLKKVKEHLMSKYGYDPGEYEQFPSLDKKNYKILAKLDWNISKDHQLSLRYNYLNNFGWNLPSQTSTPGGLRINMGQGRVSDHSIAFSRNFFSKTSIVHGFAGELNSSFSNQISNKVMVTYTATTDPKRGSNSARFPHVDIFNDNKPYMSFGYELFSYKNEVVNNTLTISDDFTYNLGKHTLLAGLKYENIYVRNNYLREGTSFYQYNSVDDFLSDKAPSGFAVTYGYNGKDPEGVALNFGLVSAYLQDEWNITSRLKLTGGVRLELPLYLNDLPSNAKVEALPELRYGTKLDLSSWPNPQLLVNPRFGFNWDVLGNRSLQVRGGSGLFSGMLPFVWFTNQPTASGIYQSPETAFSKEKLESFKFEPDFRNQQKAHPELFPAAYDAHAKFSGASLAMVEKDFKMPQIWRSNLAIDVALPKMTTLTLEGIFSKDVNAPLQRNVTLPEPTGKMSDGRPLYSGTTTMKGEITNAIVLANTDKGYQSSLTVQLRNRAIKGLDASVSYTYSLAKDLTSNPGSNAASAWKYNHTKGDINNPELSHSQFSIPHRVIGSLSYRVEYLRSMATTIGIYYSGSHTGRGSWIYGADINGDGVNGDLLYVPTDAKEINFVDKISLGKSGSRAVISAEEQAKAFMEVVEENPFLRAHKGKFIERYEFLNPWLNKFDLKLQQEFYHDFGTSRRYTIQLSLDIINAGNLLNSNWGVERRYGFSDNYGNLQPLTIQRADKKRNVKSGIVLNKSSIEAFKKANKIENKNTISSTWGMLFGARIIF